MLLKLVINESHVFTIDEVKKHKKYAMGLFNFFINKKIELI